jgi:hypothetical protein
MENSLREFSNPYIDYILYTGLSGICGVYRFSLHSPKEAGEF